MGQPADIHKAYAAREQMLAVVSHDIKNPLSAIQLEAEMLLRVADRDDNSTIANDVRAQARRILKTTDRLKALIADLLDRNKSEVGLSSLTKNESDVSKLFQDVLDSFSTLILEKNLTLTAQMPVELTLELDKNKMYQVMSNLVCNAIKFTPAYGKIHITIEELEHEYHFSVTDDGPGLDPNELEQVFEKYWTGSLTGRSGTGLGLFICKTIIEAHGGHIGAENLIDGGARFWFSLSKPEVLAQDKKQKILVIDDDDDLREVISWALDKEGYAVQSYASPELALENLRQGKHFPQLIVVDFQMDNMKGTEFLRHKKDIALNSVNNCPVVMISASPEEVESEDKDLFRKILTKPLDLEALILNVKNYMV